MVSSGTTEDASQIEAAIGLVLTGQADPAAGRLLARTLSALASDTERPARPLSASYVI